MACNCIAEMDAKLAAHNTKISVTFAFPRNGGDPYLLPTIGTEKVETRKRGGRALAIPTYCPFCGVGYAAPATPTASEEATGAMAERHLGAP